MRIHPAFLYSFPAVPGAEKALRLRRRKKEAGKRKEPSRDRATALS